MLRSLSLLALASAALSASAQNSFYGGDFDGNSGRISVVNGSFNPDYRSYDDFTLGSSTSVTELFGNFLTTSNLNILGLAYEIRSGVSAGNGGSLLFSGTVAANVSSFTIQNTFGLVPLRIGGSVSGIELGPGTYFLSVAVVSDGSSGNAYTVTTSGANGVGGPLNNGNNFYGQDFQSELASVGDYSIGLNGTAASAVPGPMAALPFALMAVKRRRAARK